MEYEESYVEELVDALGRFPDDQVARKHVEAYDGARVLGAKRRQMASLSGTAWLTAWSIKRVEEGVEGMSMEIYFHNGFRSAPQVVIDALKKLGVQMPEF